MRLISFSAEKRLFKKIREAHARMTKAVLASDFASVVCAAGALSSADPSDQRPAPSVEQVRKILKSGAVVVDREVVEHAERRLVDDARSIRDRLVSKIKAAISSGSSTLRRQKNVGRQKMKEARELVVAHMNDLVVKALENSQRDWKMIVGDAAHDAFEEARAATIVKSFGHDPLVWIQVQPDCCPFCRLLYTVDGAIPKLFNLSQLVANGSNVGRRAGRPVHAGVHATEYLPVLGATHNRCRCRLMALPPGASFGPDGVLKKEDLRGRRAG